MRTPCPSSRISLAGVLLIGVAMIAGLRSALGQCPDPAWRSMSEVPGVQGWVFSMVEWDPDGRGPRQPVLVVGGEISGAGSRSVSRVALWDGAAWSDELGAIMSPGLETGGAYSLLVHDGDLFAGTAY